MSEHRSQNPIKSMFLYHWGCDLCLDENVWSIDQLSFDDCDALARRTAPVTSFTIYRQYFRQKPLGLTSGVC